MKQIEKRKKALLLLYSYIIILLTPKLKANAKQNTTIYQENYSIKNNYIFATYNDRNIYIANELFIAILQAYNDDGIFIIDRRNSKNPTMAICDSYKIINPFQIRDIIEIILKYEEDYPSKWNRTNESMKNEWLIHNFCYYLNHEVHRTGQVDLDNNDELVYLHYIKNICNTIINDFKLVRNKK